MYAAWLFNETTGLRHTALALYKMWETPKYHFRRIFPAISSGVPAWTIQASSFIFDESANYQDWTIVKGGVAFASKRAWQPGSEFAQEAKRINGIAYYGSFGKSIGMDLAIKSLSSAYGTMAGIMAAMHVMASARGYVETDDATKFKREAMPGLMRLMGIKLSQEIKSVLTKTGIMNKGYTVVGTDMPFFYLHWHQSSGQLLGSFPDIVLQPIDTQKPIVSIELKSRWKRLVGEIGDATEKYYRKPNEKIVDAFARFHGIATTNRDNHIQCLAQAVSVRNFVAPNVLALLVNGVIRGEPYVKEVGMYSARFVVTATKEMQYQATIAMQQWTLRKPGTAYADDMVHIPCTSNAMLFAVLAQYDNQFLYLRKFQAQNYIQISVYGPHRTTVPVPVTNATIQTIEPCRLFTQNAKGVYYQDKTLAHKVFVRQACAGIPAVKDLLQKFERNCKGKTNTFIHYLPSVGVGV
jgi:hypothetical protein